MFAKISKLVIIIIVMAVSEGEFVDYYKMLGLEPSANSIQIRQAFIHKAKQNHPDVGGSTETMRHLNAAYKTLASYSHRAAYDLLHSFYTGKNTIAYRSLDPQAKPQSSADDLSDEYIDWFLDSIYAEYSNSSKSKINFGEKIKKFFSV